MPALRYRRPPISGNISALIDSIAVALSDLTIFDFVLLFEFDANLDASPHPPFALLWIFLSGRLDDLHARQHTHVDTEEHEHQSGPYYVQVATVLKASATQFERWVMIKHRHSTSLQRYSIAKIPKPNLNYGTMDIAASRLALHKPNASGLDPE
ncbi:hypothetical protein H4582DRAFT_2062818 [Lactarius indigo]|nr:hypothetical protein H4582DRAFT_2062818 [Lactarius indigo]